MTSLSLGVRYSRPKRGRNAVQTTPSKRRAVAHLPIATPSALFGEVDDDQNPIAVAVFFALIPSRCANSLVASSMLVATISAQSTGILGAPEVRTSVIRPLSDCRANSMGRLGPSESQPPASLRDPGFQINDPQPRQTTVMTKTRRRSS